MIAWRVIAVACTFLAAADASVWAASVSVSEPRAFGYFLGDTLQRDVLVRTSPGESLDLSSLPRPGPLNYWLELHALDLAEGRNGDDRLYRLSLIYQTFYAPLDPRRLVVPGFKLKIDGKAGVQELAVPEFGFITSPLRQLFTEKGDTGAHATAIKADHVARRLPTGAERTALLLSGLTALAALVGLAWHNAWWPFRRPASRPFTDAARFLRTEAAHPSGPSGYRAALLRLHRAFDVSAGKRLLADDVDGFLDQHPEFAPYADDVERMFKSSRAAFFADDIERARATMPLEAVAAFGQRLAAAERSAA